MFNGFCFSFVLQLLLVTTPSWDHVEGTMIRLEREGPDNPWKQVGAAVAVNVGKNGLAWGKGPFNAPLSGFKKREGDGKGPAGLFPLSVVFGNEAYQRKITKMPFELIDENLEAVDDPKSRYYNQLVHSKSIVDKDWFSSEKMFQVGFLYNLGVVLGHNECQDPEAGSCIFLHIWREKGRGTAGCTAMAEKDLEEVALWLDIEKHPHIMQMPIDELYKQVLP